MRKTPRRRKTPVHTRDMVDVKILAMLSRRPMKAADVGCELWGALHPYRKPQHFARPAGRFLRSLERRGLVARDCKTGMWSCFL